MRLFSAKINTIIKTIPEKTGVYKYYDKNDDLIYIGKAKNLKKRVCSYFRQKQNKKTTALVSKIYNIKYVLVNSEMDALFLENNLIKTHQPKYNTLLKDSKTYPWICISDEKIPRIFQARDVKKKQGEYFGPYTSTRVVKTLLSFFSDLFYNQGWTPFSYINRTINSKEELVSYLSVIEEVKKILQGNVGVLLVDLKRKMRSHAKRLNFEEAQIIKQKIKLLHNYQAKSVIVNPKITNVDVFSMFSKNELVFINYLKVVSGSIIQSYTVHLKNILGEKEDDILTRTIIDIRQKFLSNSKEIYVSHKPKVRIEGVVITSPKIGDKKRLVDLSLKNARYMQIKILNKKVRSYNKLTGNSALRQIQKDLSLSSLPLHIECFDNSNTQGSHPVAACVVFKQGKASKKDYRIFNIKTVVGPDDFASMEEVIYRRYLRLINENTSLPNLIIIDGGRGQLSSTIKSLEKLNLSKKISVISIAKRLEEIYFPNDKIPLYLDKRSESLRLIQTIRNEAHRFSVHHHRKKRRSSAFESSLEKINGIGPKTIDLLIQNFGSVKKVFSARKKQLEKIVGKTKASKIIAQHRLYKQ